MKMTRQQLVIKAETLTDFYADIRRHRLYSCKAEWAESQTAQTAVLFSYGTLCAVYWHGTVWEFCYYSHTTTVHVRKFAYLMNAPVVSLYRRSGISKRDYEKHTACDWSDVIDAVLST